MNLLGVKNNFDITQQSLYSLSLATQHNYASSEPFLRNYHNMLLNAWLQEWIIKLMKENNQFVESKERTVNSNIMTIPEIIFIFDWIVQNVFVMMHPECDVDLSLIHI